MTAITRRAFVAGAAAGAVAATAARARAAGANDTIILALMGANSRGSQLAEEFSAIDGVEFAYVCDPDERAVAKGVEAATYQGRRKPHGIKDFRQALDDPAVDALVCAAPNHWHAPATLLACKAGKHVYVEKPASHAASEGELMVAAARQADRIVQVGMQRRSGALFQQLIQQIRDGAIGDVFLAKSWYYRNRPTIGRGKATEPPDWLDYSLWQGPAPERPYRDNILHYNWHWFWHWGNGELGNNGIHTIDLCRWALGVNFPQRVTVAGGRWRFDDDQETPDTLTASFDCGGRSIVWEGISWAPSLGARPAVGLEFRGSKGAILADDEGYVVYDADGKETARGSGSRGDREHLEDFLAAIRTGRRPNADIEDGHKSAVFCHLGNIAYRTGRSLEVEPARGHIQNDAEATSYWACEYRQGWEPTL